MKNRSKMILGLASLLGVTAGATAVSGFAWFVTTKTATVDVTNIGVYNNNPSLSLTIDHLEGITRTNDAANDFDFKASKDSTKTTENALGDGSKTEFTIAGNPVAGATPIAYVSDVLTSVTYTPGTKTVTFADAPANGAAIRFEYWDGAALTDVSSIDGVNIYDPTWQTAYEGRTASLIPYAVAGEQYISFDMNFARVDTGSLKIYLSQPTITAVSDTTANNAAADVTRVAFSIDGANVLTLSNKADVEGTDYKRGISKNLVEPDGGTNARTTTGTYNMESYLDNCQNLAKPATENYFVRSNAPAETAAANYLTTVSSTNVTVHVAIWLEGTSHVNGNGDYSAPIGGEINVSLPIVAFGA